MKPEELQLLLSGLTALELEPGITLADRNCILEVVSFVRLRLRWKPVEEFLKKHE